MNINEPVQGGGFSLPFIKDARQKRRARGASSVRSNRLPFLNFLPDSARNHFVATTAEYAGTTLFLLFAFCGTQVALNTTVAGTTNAEGSNPAQQLYIALCFGFSLAVNAWVFFRISGGLFNPAVTLGMCLVGALPYIRGLFLLVAQILGGITAAAIAEALLPGPLTVRTSLAAGTSVTQGLFIEMFLTAELVFTIFMLAAEKHKGTFIAPIGIGLSLFIAELMGVYWTGGSVNPARSFGPSVVTHSFHSYHWIYWVGPILGSLLASGFYKFIKMLEYETANPDQDASKPEGEHFNPDNVDVEAGNAPGHVAFAPGQYVPDNMTHGDPKEYGMERRPFSDSPAPPHKNDQFAGLTQGGMHSSEYVQTIGNRESVLTTNTLAATESGSDHANPYHNTNNVPMTSLSSPTTTLGGNNLSPTTAGNSHHVTSPTRSAMKSGKTGGPLPANGTERVSHERSARSNMYHNQNITAGGPRDDDFYDKA